MGLRREEFGRAEARKKSKNETVNMRCFVVLSNAFFACYIYANLHFAKKLSLASLALSLTSRGPGEC
jgi:hypothetical protein